MATNLSRHYAGRSARPIDHRSPLRKDNHVFNYQIAQIVHQERQREIERQIVRRAAIAARSRSIRSRSMRQRIGSRVIDIGNAIAADGSRNARINRDPCGSLGELAARR
jgi:hypothetical protein